MAFLEQADSLRTKVHLSGVRTPVLVGVTALAALVLVLAGKGVLDATTGDFSVERADGVSAQVAVSEEGAGQEAELATVFVHVGGAVVAPGVQELVEGARVQDAVAAAGGFAEDAAHDALNLARVVIDGEQVVVPTVQEVENQTQAAAAGASGVSSGTTRGSSAFGGKVNINAATAAELDTLPGVGPATAEKIVADREANGPFVTTEDLKRVSGIGDKKYANLAESICVG